MLKGFARFLGLPILLLCVVAAPSHASDGRDDAEGARIAVAAFRAEDRARLRAVARSEHGDVWVVVEQLLGNGSLSVAKAVVEARGSASDAEHLTAYVRWRAEHPLAPDTWSRLDALEPLRQRNDLAALRGALQDVPLPDGGVARVVYLRLRARVQEAPAEAMSDLRAAAEEAQSVGWSDGALLALTDGAEVAYRLRDHEQTVDFGEVLLPLAVERRHRTLCETTHRRMATALRALGRRQDALRHGAHALDLAVGTRAERDALRHLIVLGVGVVPLHRLREQMTQLQTLEEALGNESGVAACDVRLAAVEAALGRWTSAVRHLERALAHVDRHGQDWQRRGAHLNAATVSLQMLDLPRAREHLRIAREVGADLDLDEIPLLALEATAFALDRDHAAAERAFRDVIARTKPSAREDLADRWIALTEVQLRGGRPDVALESLRIAREAVEATGDPVRRAHWLCAESRAHFTRGDIEAALRSAETARRLCDEHLLSGLGSVVDTRLAEAWLARGEASRACDHVDRAIEGILRRSAALPERLGAQYRAELRGTFGLAIDAAVAAEDTGRFFQAAERARGVALRTRLGGRSMLLDALDPALRTRELELREAETQAVRAYRSTLPSADAEAKREAFAALGRVREQVDRHRERVHVQHAALAQLFDPQILAPDDVRSSLGPKDAQVHFARGLETVFALVVTNAGSRIVQIGSSESIQALLDRIVLEDAASPADGSLAALRGMLEAPLLLPASIERLVVVPTGRLELIPFAALWPDREVTLLPSATIGRLLTKRVAEHGSVILAIGSPAGGGSALPGAEREAREAGHEHLLGASATEEALQDAVGRRKHWRAVHFACHGLIDPEHPLRSALALAPSEASDGLLTVSEVLGCRISTDLVVLAACSTAQGQAFEQEGRVGFVHAFFAAGATRVLASLWDVDDAATAALMTRFYAALDRGTSPAEALRSAQRHVRAEPRWRHPAHWAAWQLWGPHTPR